MTLREYFFWCLRCLAGAYVLAVVLLAAIPPDHLQ